MRVKICYLTPFIAAAGAAAAILAAPRRDRPSREPSLPTCTTLVAPRTSAAPTTECATPGNVQINAAPAEPTYPYPWDDEFYGPALIIGGGGGGGGHGGGGRNHNSAA